MVYELVKPTAMTDVWVQTKPLFDKALKHAHGELTSEDIRRAALKGQTSIFIAHDKTTIHAALACELVPYPGFTALNIIVMAGARNTVTEAHKEFIPWLRNWAKAQGAEKIESRCHPSMAKLLQRYGFHNAYAVMMQDLG